MYLRAAFQHRGLGNILLDYAEEIARKEGKDYIWLGVYEKNINAQHFYKRHGFEKVSQHTFQVGSDLVNGRTVKLMLATYLPSGERSAN